MKHKTTTALKTMRCISVLALALAVLCTLPSSAHHAQDISTGLSGGAGDVSNTCTNAGSITGSTAEGIMFYNIDEDVMQYCNGEEWIGIGQ